MKAPLRRLIPTLAFLLAAALPAAAAIKNWLPVNINSAYGQKIDDLYFGIYWIVGIFFFLTEGILLYCIVMFRRREGVKAKYMHGSQTLEIIWTVIPALILVGIGVAQAGTWKEIRMDFPAEGDKNNLVVQVFAKQYNWQFRYAGKDGVFGTEDDQYTDGVIHIKPDQKVICKLASSDVIHSFFIPNARVKLDAVPGMLGRLWFVVDRHLVYNMKTGQMDMLKPEELKTKKVGFPLGFQEIGGFIFVEEELDKDASLKSGLKKYSYKVKEGATTVKALYQGKFIDVAPGDVDVVLHRFDIACAELCGLGHTKMNAYLSVDPPEVYDFWVQHQPPGGPPAERFNDYWDKAHPTWNKVIN